MSEVVYHGIEMFRRNKVLSEEPLLRMILALQTNMDYENLANFLIKRKRSDLLLVLF